MIYSYEDVISKYKNNYQLNKALKDKKIFKIIPGIYSSQEFVNYLQVISKK